MNNMDLYNKLRSVPAEAKKEIAAGRLKGFTDINPMWRIKALTETFGPCGIGWWYKITDKRLEAYNDEIKAFVDIELYYTYKDQTGSDTTVYQSQPVVGTGGAPFVTQEKNGPYVSDECFKMALTDAISVAAKSLGVGADVYYDKDRDKYNTVAEPPKVSKKDAEIAKDIEIARAAAGPVLKCDMCDKAITKPEYEYSMGKYKRPLCRACQKKA